MCGISGVLMRPDENASLELVSAMARRMQTRGPDAQGTYAFRNLGASHRRLKVIDLSDSANQPIFNEDGKVGVVFNGEIYNFLELKKELQEDGHLFRSHTDTEIIVHAFEKWGTGAFSKFNGMFAFALWDCRGGDPVVYLVRDRFGIKPLFYSLDSERLAFASELKSLFEVPWINRDIDSSALHSYIKFSHFPNPSTVLRSVRQLAPASYLKVTRGKSEEAKCYWHQHESKSNDAIDESSALERLDQILTAVVTRQAVSDVPLGCFLSGGVDSSLLAIALQETRSDRIKTYSVGYAESEYDETPYARLVAQSLGTEHHDLILQPKDFFDLIPDLPEYGDQPLGDPTLLPSLLLSKFAKRDVTVAFSGDGGDELYFGYLYQQIIFRLKPLLALPTSARCHFFSWAETVLSAVSGGGNLRFPTGARRRQALRKFCEILQAENETQFLEYWIGMVGPLKFSRLSRIIASSPQFQHPPTLSSPDFQSLSWENKIEQAFQTTFLPDTVLAKSDKASMAFSLEARVPFLDNEMVEFSSGLPFSLKYRHGSKKYLLRKLLQRKFERLAPGIAKKISARKKQGFSIPLENWLRNDLKYLLDEYLNAPRLRREGIFNPAEIVSLTRAHLEGRANHSHFLWSLIVFQLWKERFLP